MTVTKLVVSYKRKRSSTVLDTAKRILFDRTMFTAKEVLRTGPSTKEGTSVYSGRG